MKFITIFMVVSIILIGCSQPQTFTKEDKIYNPPVPRENIPKSPEAIVNDSLINDYEDYCSDIELPKSF